MPRSDGALALFYHGVRSAWQQPLRYLGELPATFALGGWVENPHDIESVARPLARDRCLRSVARHEVPSDFANRLMLPRNQNDTALSQDLLRQSGFLPFTKINDRRDVQFLSEGFDGLQGTLAFTGSSCSSATPGSRGAEA